MRPLSKIRALSIKQPWAECIVSKGKNVENRDWNTRYRGFFAIHASASTNLELFDDCAQDYRIRIDPDRVPYGVIVGFAELVGVVTVDSLTRDTKRWFVGDYGFVLENIIKLRTPVPAKGALSFWELRGKALRLSFDQLTSAQIKKILSRPLGK